MTDVLELNDADAPRWFARQGARDPDPEAPARIHLLVGCSIAKGSKMDAEGDDLVVNRARSGETWSKLADLQSDDIRTWQRAASCFGLEKGSVIIWISGNDAYDKHSGANLFLDMDPIEEQRLEATIRDVLAAYREVAAGVVVLGPLPRFAHDRFLPWEHTAAYKLDRKVKEATTKEEFHSLGKALTMKLKRRHVVRDECADWFSVDGVHLTPAGYRKVAAADSFPKWLHVLSDGQ